MEPKNTELSNKIYDIELCLDLVDKQRNRVHIKFQ